MHIQNPDNASLLALCIFGLITFAIALQSTLGFAMDSFSSAEPLGETEIVTSTDALESEASTFFEASPVPDAFAEPLDATGESPDGSEGYAGTEIPEGTVTTATSAEPAAACDPCDSNAECFDGCDVSCAPDYCDESGGCYMATLCTATASTSSPETFTTQSPIGTSASPSG